MTIEEHGLAGGFGSAVGEWASDRGMGRRGDGAALLRLGAPIMANWQRKLDLKDVWDSRDVPVIAKAASERLRRLAPIGDDRLDYEREQLADQFAELATDPSADTDEFDSIMHELYDWADTKLDDSWNGKKVCWVATF